MNTIAVTLRHYYTLTKPGIIRGNVMTAVAGFLFASQGNINLVLLIQTVFGIASIIASACVINNYIDRDIDSKMTRTKKRALVTGDISVRNALIYATLLCVIGYWVLWAYTNLLTVLIGAIGMFSYVALYGYYKRNSVHGTLVGSISGSTALVAGYCAVTGRFDMLALLLFIIMSIWQMPHFYAIGIYKLKDYKQASLPILPAISGVRVTKKHIAVYILLFTFAASSLTLFGYTGYVYLFVMLAVSLLWLRTALRGFAMKDNVKYGHQIFGQSLITLLLFSLMISVDHYLP